MSTHNLNSIVLELNAGNDLKIGNNGDFATVFALHNPYAPEGVKVEAIPISVLFPKYLVPYAKTVIRTGSHFTVQGTLTYRTGEDSKGYYSIRATQLTPIHVPEDEDAADAAAGDSAAGDAGSDGKSVKRSSKHHTKS